ncbi:MAG: hypothetical protein ABI134_03690 [Byssovorax sp.]
MAELETVHTDSTLRIVNSRNVQVNVWSNAPTVEQMRAHGRAGTAHARRHPRGTGLLNIVVGGTPSFSEPVRVETVKIMKQAELFSLGSAQIILAGGLTGTAVRAFMSTVILLGRPLRPTKVFSDSETAVAWIAPLLTRGAEPWSRAELAALVAQLVKAERRTG